MDINTPEFEKQRRQAIIDSGEYLRFEIIIGKEIEKVNGHKGHIPSTMLEMKHAGPKQISDLYLCLLEFIKYLEKEYPKECLMGHLTGKCSNLGDFDYNSDEEA